MLQLALINLQSASRQAPHHVVLLGDEEMEPDVAGDMASVVAELEGYIRETQASGGQQVTVLKQVLSG